MSSKGRSFIEVRRQSPRFQLIRKEIEKLEMNGIYRFIGDCDSIKPMVWQATRHDLEHVFAQAMSTPSYTERGLFHQLNWGLADQFRVE